MALRLTVLSVEASLILATVFALPVAEQVNTGTIEVNTNDPEGEAVPGVAVVVVNIETALGAPDDLECQGSRHHPCAGSRQLRGWRPIPGGLRSPGLEAGYRAPRRPERLRSHSPMSVPVTADAVSVSGRCTHWWTCTSSDSVDQYRDRRAGPGRPSGARAATGRTPGLPRAGGAARTRRLPLHRRLGADRLLGQRVRNGPSSSTASDFTDQVLGLVAGQLQPGRYRRVQGRQQPLRHRDRQAPPAAPCQLSRNRVPTRCMAVFSGSIAAMRCARSESSRRGRRTTGATSSASLSAVPSSETGRITSCPYEYVNEDSITFFRPQGAYLDLAEDFPVPVLRPTSVSPASTTRSASNRSSSSNWYTRSSPWRTSGSVAPPTSRPVCS